MSKPIDQERADFDAWFKSSGMEKFKETAWAAWQARASVQPASVAVPEGWLIERQGDRIIVQRMQDGTGYAAERNGDSGIAESVLYLLADTLLAAAPHPVSGEKKASDTERLDYLQEQMTDTIYLDDGRIIDIAGRVTVREAIDAHRAQQGEQP